MVKPIRKRFQKNSDLVNKKLLEKILLSSKMVNKIDCRLLIKSGGGTGPAMPGNPLEREGAKSCGTEGSGR